MSRRAVLDDAASVIDASRTSRRVADVEARRTLALHVEDENRAARKQRGSIRASVRAWRARYAMRKVTESPAVAQAVGQLAAVACLTVALAFVAGYAWGRMVGGVA